MSTRLLWVWKVFMLLFWYDWYWYWNSQSGTAEIRTFRPVNLRNRDLVSFLDLAVSSGPDDHFHTAYKSEQGWKNLESHDLESEARPPLSSPSTPTQQTGRSGGYARFRDLCIPKDCEFLVNVYGTVFDPCGVGFMKIFG